MFCINSRADGSLNCYKALLIAIKLTRMAKTFSPIVKLITASVNLLTAISHNWPVRQLDVSNAFCYGRLSENVFGFNLLVFFYEKSPIICFQTWQVSRWSQIDASFMVSTPKFFFNLIGFFQLKNRFLSFFSLRDSTILWKILLIWMEDFLALLKAGRDSDYRWAKRNI